MASALGEEPGKGITPETESMGNTFFRSSPRSRIVPMIAFIERSEPNAVAVARPAAVVGLLEAVVLLGVRSAQNVRRQVFSEIWAVLSVRRNEKAPGSFRFRGIEWPRGRAATTQFALCGCR